MVNEDPCEKDAERCGPFHYLTEVAVPDLRASAALWETYEAKSEEFVQGSRASVLPCVNCRLQDIIRQSQSSNREQRIVAVLAILRHWPREREGLNTLLELAFADHDSRVRGIALRAWLKISQDTVDVAEEVLGEALFRRFLDNKLSQDPVVVSGVAYIWREMLSIECETERDRLSEEEAFTGTLEKLAGNTLPQIQGSLSAAIQFLRHSDPRLREAAVYLIGRKWEPTQEFLRFCEDATQTDVDDAVRSAAMGVLTRYWKGTGQRRICEILAAILRDPDNAKLLRQQAYLSLYEVVGAPRVESMVPKMLKGTFILERDVRWDFVDSFLPDGGD